MAPGLVDDAGTRRALVAHAGVRAIIDLWDRLDVALFGIGGPAWTPAVVGEGVARQLARDAAVGEVLVAPFDLDGRFVCPALRERVIALDARRLRRIPVAIGVAAGEGKVRPILGALRAGIVRSLVTDVATAEAVVALDLETAPADAADPMSGREPAVLGLDLGTTEVKAGLVTPRRTPARPRAQRLRPRRRAAATAGRSRTRARGGRRSCRRSGRCARRTSPRSWRSASTVTGRRSPRSMGVARRPAARSPSSTRARRAEAAELAAATGVRGWALGGLPAALWVERHEPAVAAATRWYLATWEWLAFRLTGIAAGAARPGPARPGSRRRDGGRRPGRSGCPRRRPTGVVSAS